MSIRLKSGELQTYQLDALLGDVHDALIVTDPRGSVLYMNSAAGSLFGFEDLDPHGRKGLDLLSYVRQALTLSTITGEEVPDDEQPLTRALRGQRYKDVELRVRRNDSGDERVFAFSGTRLEGDPPLGVLAIRDVTEQYKAERRYRISFETNPAPTVIARLDDALIVDVNEGFTDLTGLAKHEMKGRSLMSLGLLPGSGELQQLIDGLKEGLTIAQQQTKINRVDSGERDVLVAARPIEIEGQACGICTFIDITELQLAQRRLRENASELLALHQERDIFNYSVAHDLRAPLRGIDGFSQVLLEDYGDKLDDKGRRYLERVKSGAARIGELTDSLLALSRLARGELNPRDVDLSGMARQVAAALQEEQPERQVSFEISAGLVVHGDRDLLHVLLSNLLQNAWRFTQGVDGPRIEVASERQGEEVVYFVRDNGVGFDPKFSSRLFEPFQRLPNPTGVEGLGVGLAAAQRVIQRHNGRIWAEGNEGKGATFYFTLPPRGSA